LLNCFYLGIVLYAPALIIAQMTDFSITMAILAMGALTNLYTMLGGIRAVTWTDSLQLFVLLGGLGVSS
jgi:solute:Na+ symporter, SSS family